MARISTYAIDTVVTLLDRWIGTDSNSGNATKNFTAQSIADLFNNNGSIGIVNQNNFKFQTNLTGGRRPGTVSLISGGGNNTAFSDLTSFRISKDSLANTLASNYLLTLVDEPIMLAQVDDLNNFGVYKLDSLTQDVTETDFYNANLTLIESNGSLFSEETYGLITYPKAKEDEGDKNYVHPQGVASAVWTVTHNLNKFPSCTMVLSTGQQGYGDVTFIDENNLTITFAGAESGKAYIN
jgi:hypothetical protein